jgi:hypothetical protein
VNQFIFAATNRFHVTKPEKIQLCTHIMNPLIYKRIRNNKLKQSFHHKKKKWKFDLNEKHNIYIFIPKFKISIIKNFGHGITPYMVLNMSQKKKINQTKLRDHHSSNYQRHKNWINRLKFTKFWNCEHVNENDIDLRRKQLNSKKLKNLQSCDQTLFSFTSMENY